MIQKDGVTTDDQYGMEAAIDLYGCDPTKISSAESICQFVIKLCDEVILMKRYGEPFIPHFGHNNPVTSGYSLVQLIETSSVTAHFSEFKKSAYINIFSCKWFDAPRTAKFCKDWFSATSFRSRVLPRK